MSEAATSALDDVSSVFSGNTILSYPKDAASNRYGDSFRSTVCPNPKASETELKRFEADLQLKTETTRKMLQPLADFDNSGFVSSDEGKEFRDLFFFGLKASYVRSHEGPDSAALARGLGISVERYQERARRYIALREKLGDAGRKIFHEL
jgi:hypothetical protein